MCNFVFMIHYSKIALSLLVLFVSLNITAQALNLTSYQLNRKNGLPYNNIRSMTQDTTGFLWLGTLHGLVRYDGYTTRFFGNETDGENTLVPNGRINRVEKWGDNSLVVSFPQSIRLEFDTKELKYQRLTDSLRYVATFCQGQSYSLDNRGNVITRTDSPTDILYHNVKTNRTVRLRAIPEFLWRLSSDIKLHVVTDRRGMIWVSTAGGGISIFNQDGILLRTVTARQPDHIIPSDYITDMIEDNDGNIMVSEQWFGITVISINKKKMNHIPLCNDENSLPNAKEVKVLRSIRGGKVVVANDVGDVFYLEDGKTEQCLLLPKGEEYLCVNADGEGKLIAGTRNSGVFIGMKQLKHLDGMPSIVDNRVDDILADKKGRLWICNINGMVDMLQRRGDDWTVRHFFQQQKGLEVRNLIMDGTGDIWMATNHGVIHFNPDKLISNSDDFAMCRMGDKKEDIQVNCLFEDTHHNIWAGTSGKGVYMMKKSSSSLSFSPFNIASGIIETITAITEDGKGNIWMAGDDGVVCYSPSKNSISTLYSQDALLWNIFNNKCIATLSDGNVALGSLDGVLVTDREALISNTNASRLEITDMMVNGRFYPINCASSKIEFGHNENTISFNISDFSFDAGQATYFTYWMEGLEKDWRPGTKNTSITFSELPPGNYTLHVRMATTNSTHSLNGDDMERSISFTILPPWYQTWWFYLLVAILTIGIIGKMQRDYIRHLKLKQSMHEEQLLTEYRLRFFTNISHEFRTPLTIIQGSLEKIMSQEKIGEASKPSLNIMRKGVERMRRLVDQFMEFRKVETDNMQLRIEETDVVELLRSIYTFFRDTSDRRRINYIFSPSAKKITGYVDCGYLDKIVYNLLSNAFKYTPVGGEIRLSVRVTESTDSLPHCEGRRSAFLYVEVSDTGVGVPEENREKLFERYNKSKIKTDSVGIGLNLCAELVRHHHGTIGYKPGERNGSVFFFSLPIDKDAYEEKDFMTDAPDDIKGMLDINRIQERAHRFVGNPMNDKTVLIVEDDDDVRDYLQQEMVEYFHVVVARDGEEAIEIIEEEMPHIVITDIRMPRMNGYQLLEHIRNSNYRFLPVIMLSADISNEVQYQSIRHGADVYLPKPFETRVLIAHTASLISKYEEITSSQNDGQQRVATTCNSSPSCVSSKRKEREPIIVDERDRKFIERFETYIDTHISDKELNVDQVSESLGVSRSKLYRKVTELFGCSPKEYIRERRMKLATQLLISSEVITVSEVAYRVGFATPQYFTTVFHAYYGILPSEYQRHNGAKHPI